MKSHDHHVFMKVPLPIAFSALPAKVLEPLSTLIEFFKNLCANKLREDPDGNASYNPYNFMQIGDNISISILECNVKCSNSFSTRSILGWASPLQVDVSI